MTAREATQAPPASSLPAQPGNERQRQQGGDGKKQSARLDKGGGIAHLDDEAAIAAPRAETRDGDEQQGDACAKRARDLPPARQAHARSRNRKTAGPAAPATC